MRDKLLKPTTDASELLRRINRFLAEEPEEENLTIDELRQSLIEDGIDPDELLENVKKRLQPYIKFKEKPE